ncbi:serine/threonine protein kinase [Mycobacterium gordonae]|uniref:non-specific serine/threonine protein kinase n=1 Tax=Mycobacterium gordonae TaxID=1778 RepID=A0A0Q2RN62_MYCGO|nr:MULTISPECIES: serine/threonine-protein kinase [Mycobacterium]KQH76827.1 serine/threonine protein kinase [Mycobacterium gordonae]MDP7728510.1 serine/threonine-protein kinase [Mycobacterium sp. TY813]
MPTSADRDPTRGLQEGELFAGYTIVRRLGAGGMGEVYLAQHPRLPRRDALKILPAEFTTNQEFRARFNREAELAGSLYNEHIVGIHDRGEYEGQLWLSMDYVEGTDAAQLLRDRYPSGMPLPEVVDIVTAVAEALDYAHSRGLLHRDVKPANILLGEAAPRRRILLADFGIARELGDVSGLTATNMTMGTTAYCPPEQLQASDLDGRADQYALGCTAYQLLTGGAPFQNSNPAVVISQHLSAPPPLLSERRPELAYLDGVIARALAKDRSARFASCSDFAAALAAPVGTADASGPTIAVERATEVIAAATPAPSGRRRGALIATVAAVVLIAVAAVLAVVVMRGHSGGQQSAGPSSSPAGIAPTNGSAGLPALKLTTQITDQAHVLGPGERVLIERAVNKLYAGQGTRLWVVYVNDFGGVKPAKWTENVIRSNGFTDADVLLGITTDRPSFVFHVPAAVTVGRPIDIELIRRDRIKPDVERREWTKAALAAAIGLDVPIR